MQNQQLLVSSTPISSQQIQSSIEPVDSQAWGQPPLLPQSQTPSQRSQTSSQRSQTLSSQSLSPSKEQLTKDDHIHVLRLAIQAGNAYCHGTDKTFWKKIANAFEAATGKKHKSLDRAVSNIVKTQRKYLTENDSGEERAHTSYTDAVDNWISILDARKALNEAQKEAQGQRNKESEASLKWRNDSMKLWSDRLVPQRLAKKRRLQLPEAEISQAGSSQAESLIIDDEDSEEPSTSHPASTNQSTSINSIATSSASSTPPPEH